MEIQDEQLNNSALPVEGVAEAAVVEETTTEASVVPNDLNSFEERNVVEPKRKNTWLSTVFFVVVLALSLLLMYQLSRAAADGNEKTLAEIVQHMRWDYLLFALGTLVLMMFLDTMKYLIIMHATVKGRNFGMAMKTSFLGRYYDYITPFSSGGQPFQIYYLHKKGLTGGQSTAVIFIKFCFNMLMWLTICFCLMVFNHSALVKWVADETQRNLFTVFGWIGFGVNCFVPITIIAFAIFPKIMEAISRWVLTIGHKLKLVKDRDAIVLNAKRISRDFRSAFVIMAHKPLHAIGLVLCCICEPFLGMVLPYLVVVALAGEAVVPSWELMFAIMTLNVYVSMTVTIVPTPGNSGAMENAFLLVLTTVAEGVLFWTVLTWRFLSYYTYVIIGMVMVIADFVRKQKQKRMNK